MISTSKSELEKALSQLETIISLVSDLEYTLMAKKLFIIEELKNTHNKKYYNKMKIDILKKSYNAVDKVLPALQDMKLYDLLGVNTLTGLQNE